MKKALYLAFIFYSLCFFFSCSDSSNTQSTDNTSSLKNIAEQNFKQINWTEPLEGERLTAKISSVDTIEKRIQLSPAVVLNSSYASSLSPIFPYLEGFTSLDLSSFNSLVKSLAQKFASALCTGNVDTTLFEKDNIFEAALFYNDLKQLWKSEFSQEFPENAKETDSLETQEKELFILFDEYLFGEPFEMNSLYEVPVRFIRKKTGSVDVMIYFFKDELNSWKIDQLKIIKMTKNG